MRLADSGNAITVWLSASDTWGWAHEHGASWPCSTLEGKRIRADFDSNGLLDLTVDGRRPDHVDNNEFSSLVSDSVKGRIPKDHPCWFVVVGQFQGAE